MSTTPFTLSTGQRHRAIWVAILLSLGGAVGSVGTMLVTDTHAVGAENTAEALRVQPDRLFMGSADAAERWATQGQNPRFTGSADAAERWAQTGERAALDY